MTRFKSSLLLSGIVLCYSSALLASPAQIKAEIKTLWKASTPDRPLKTWSVAEIQGLKAVTTHEKDPSSGAKSAWHGPEMSLLVDRTIETLPGDDKAQVDLIIVRDAAGDQVQIPRWLVVKYPVLLTTQKSGVKLVLPITSRPKIREEGLPLERLQFHEVAEIEFANSHQIYGRFYLKHRMDPMAVRGEKIFIQNCTSCHGIGGETGIEKSARKLASGGHPQISDAPQLKGRDLRALSSYLEALRLESGLESSKTAGASFTGK